jgi:dTDP-4-amino-4,6-dideoxygalactose transaminase
MSGGPLGCADSPTLYDVIIQELINMCADNTCIPFNRPVMVGNELQYMAQAIAGEKLSGDGPFTSKCSALLEQELGVSKVLLTTSCTHALEMMAILLDLQSGDEVIIPSFTFVSTVNAFVLRGAKPVFVDIRPDTLNLDENKLEALITPRTKAIIPVHYAGVGCEMDAILEIAARHNVRVVEDNAHGLFGKYKNKYLGSFGALAAQSFHETKNFSCGEGGALLINDPELAERAEIIREKGTNRGRFLRGQVDKYTWVDIGSSYLPSDILAAFLYAQLESREKIQNRRQKNWEAYQAGLKDWAARYEVRLPHIPICCEQSYHLFYMLLPSLEIRQRLIRYLREHDIMSAFHYLPLHSSEMGMRFGGQIGDCPITEIVSDQLLRLPFHNFLSDDDQDRIIETIVKFEF